MNLLIDILCAKIILESFDNPTTNSLQTPTLQGETIYLGNQPLELR
jgi:hypothetical protein